MGGVKIILKKMPKQPPFLRNIITIIILMVSLSLAFPAYSVADGTPAPNPAGSPQKLLTESLNAHQVKLSWLDKSANEQGFKIERATDRAFSQNLTGFSTAADATSYIDESTAPLTVYYYRVKSHFINEESAWSNIAIALTPDAIPTAPTGLIVSSPASFQVQLIWTDNSNNESGFKVERASNSSFTENLIGFKVDANINKCLDTITPGGIYYYRVTAYNNAGGSEPSKTESVAVDNRLDEGTFLIGPVTADVITSGFAQYSLPFKVNSAGLVQNSDITLTLADQRGKVTLSRGTKMLNFNKHALTALSYNSPSIVAQPPADRVVLGAFDFGPTQATFDPPVTMVLKYSPVSLPQGISANNMKVGAWDGTKWELLDVSSINTGSGEVTVKVNRTCLLAIMATKTQIPFPYSVADLVIIPSEVNGSVNVLLQVTAKNSGTIPGNYELTVMFNDEIKESRVVALEGETSYTETFHILNIEPKYYNVNVNGLKKVFEVQPTPSPTAPSLTPLENNTPTSIVDAPTSTFDMPKSNYVPRKPNMTLILGIAGAMVVIILGSLLFFFARK